MKRGSETVKVKVPRPVDPEPGSDAIAAAETTAAQLLRHQHRNMHSMQLLCVGFLNSKSLDFNKMFKATTRCALGLRSRRLSRVTVTAEFDETGLSDV